MGSAGTSTHRAGRRRVGIAVRTVIAALLATAALALGACSSDENADRDAGIRVAATTPIIAEFAERVAGPDATVTVLIPAGVDVHGFSPSPSVARTVVQADLILVNGYNLEEGLLSLVEENRSDDAPLVAVAAGLEVLGGDDSDSPSIVRAAGDPHLWLAVENAIGYVERIADALVAVDSAHEDGYRARAGAYIEELRALDSELRETLAPITQERRRLVVFHDAYRYFAQAYGFELSAAVRPASPSQESSAAAVAEVIAIVEALQIPAVFHEPQFDAAGLEAVARETGAELRLIYSSVGGDIGSYAELMRANASSLVAGLGR